MINHDVVWNGEVSPAPVLCEIHMSISRENNTFENFHIGMTST